MTDLNDLLSKIENERAKKYENSKETEMEDYYEKGNGNVVCKVCGKTQALTFNACIYCCTHDELNLMEDWHGLDDGGGWELDAVCSKCGKNFFSHKELLNSYNLTKKKLNG